MSFTNSIISSGKAIFNNFYGVSGAYFKTSPPPPPPIPPPPIPPPLPYVPIFNNPVTIVQSTTNAALCYISTADYVAATRASGALVSGVPSQNQNPLSGFVNQSFPGYYNGITGTNRLGPTAVDYYDYAWWLTGSDSYSFTSMYIFRYFTSYFTKITTIPYKVTSGHINEMIYFNGKLYITCIDGILACNAPTDTSTSVNISVINGTIQTAYGITFDGDATMYIGSTDGKIYTLQPPYTGTLQLLLTLPSYLTTIPNYLGIVSMSFDITNSILYFVNCDTSSYASETSGPNNASGVYYYNNLFDTPTLVYSEYTRVGGLYGVRWRPSTQRLYITTIHSLLYLS